MRRLRGWAVCNVWNGVPLHSNNMFEIYTSRRAAERWGHDVRRVTIIVEDLTEADKRRRERQEAERAAEPLPF